MGNVRAIGLEWQPTSKPAGRETKAPLVPDGPHVNGQITCHRHSVKFLLTERAEAGRLFPTHPPRLSTMRNWRVFLLADIIFNKPALSIGDQVELLKQRGMSIPDKDRAEHYLRFIGYYRLSGYWVPFQLRDSSCYHDHFRINTCFETVLDRYIFDRRLRLAIIDAIERIEVAARAAVSNSMAEMEGPHWYTMPQSFTDHFKHEAFLARVGSETGIDPENPRKQTDFIRHYVRNYGNPALPPSWMTFELLPFGMVSTVYAHLHKTSQNKIANVFFLPRKRLKSWLHAMSHLRNLCAHHSRIWNREFGVSPSLPKTEAEHCQHPKHFYAHAIAIQSLLKTISGDSHWSDRLMNLFLEHPKIPMASMGFPQDWNSHDIWQK